MQKEIDNYMMKLGEMILKKLELLRAKFSGDAYCYTCGFVGSTKARKVLWPDLIKEWDLSPEWEYWFNEREGRYCVNCHSSLRTNQLSQQLLNLLNQQLTIQETTIDKAFQNAKVHQLRIAEINSAGTIHPFLQPSPGLVYSEYASQDPSIPSESLLGLTYADNYFDMVITSETLEHVPDVRIALKEIWRVLKPGGLHVFTVPIIWDRLITKQRAKIENGDLVYLHPPSYHGSKYENQADYLVFYEFGLDFIEFCKSEGFEMDWIKDEHNPALVCFTAKKIN